MTGYALNRRLASAPAGKVLTDWNWRNLAASAPRARSLAGLAVSKALASVNWRNEVGGSAKAPVPDATAPAPAPAGLSVEEVMSDFVWD